MVKPFYICLFSYLNLNHMLSQEEYAVVKAVAECVETRLKWCQDSQQWQLCSVLQTIRDIRTSKMLCSYQTLEEMPNNTFLLHCIVNCFRWQEN